MHVATCHCHARRAEYGTGHEKHARTHAWFLRPGTGSNRRLPSVRRRPRFGAPRERQREPCPVRADRIGALTALATVTVTARSVTFCESSDTLIFFFREIGEVVRRLIYLID